MDLRTLQIIAMDLNREIIAQVTQGLSNREKVSMILLILALTFCLCDRGTSSSVIEEERS